MRLLVRVFRVIHSIALKGQAGAPGLLLASAVVAVAALAATLALVLTPGTAHGANFSVNNSADLGDANPGDGGCETVRTGAGSRASARCVPLSRRRTRSTATTRSRFPPALSR